MYLARMGCLIGALGVTASAPAGVFDSGSDGSDGPFVPAGPTTVVDLGLATPGQWDTTPGNGDGVYDADVWAVVFKYTTISINPGVTVQFLNHPSGAPVVWLATGDVTIQGIVNLDGQAAFDSFNTPFAYSTPGPGGFAGGAGRVLPLQASGGFGPGGGAVNLDGQYAAGSASYGNPNIVPLIGGSGGGGHNGTDATAGAGGGAILIASSGNMSLAGGSLVKARGGNQFSTGSSYASGSGGAIRLIANEIAGSGALSADGGSGSGSASDGRIRLEAFSIAGYTGTSIPPLTFSGPGTLFPSSTAPVLRATTIDGQPIPVDPGAGIETKDVVVQNDSVLLQIEAMNIPVGTTVEVFVKPAHGDPFFVFSSPLVGTFVLSTAQASITLPDAPVEIHLKANWVP